MAGKGGVRPNAGRKPSIQNRISRDMRQEALDKYPGFNPITALLEFYHTNDDPKLKLDCLKELAKKFVPDMKAVDVVTDGQSLNTPSIIQLIGDAPTD